MITGTGLDTWGFAALCVVSFIGSFIAASLGLGGGMLVMATMASLLPPTVLVPLHGIVQLGSNIGRTFMFRSHVQILFIPPFALGTMIGAFIGGNLMVNLPIEVLQIVLGSFILCSIFGPKLRVGRPSNMTFVGIGLFGAFATMFVGATGPLVAPFAAAASKKRQEVVATLAAMMTIQHSSKVIVFGGLGFEFSSYLPLLVGLLIFGICGTWAGKHILNFMPEHIFRIVLKIILTVLALRLLFVGIFH